MNIFEYVTLGLLGLTTLETSYLLFRSSKKSVSRLKSTNPIFVDTSVLMDGRIVGIANAGFITGELVIPRSVILELQLLADKSDHEKRERARFGLDVVAKLQALDTVRVHLHRDEPAKSGVDERLLELARSSKGYVLTIDYNLQKVAATEGIKVLNLNELAQVLRLDRLPGEKLMLTIIEKGSDSHQGVGYLEDGTMVVVEHASSKLGQAIMIEIIRSLQTSAGRMCFARIVESKTTPTVTSAKKPVAQKSIKPVGRRKPMTRPMQKSTEPHTNEQTKQKNHKPKTSKQREASLIHTIEQLGD